ncbi:MAG: hypothetical protein WC340_00995 [Kiritimatiellia bacterium]
MNRYCLFVVVALGAQSALTQNLPKIQSFESTATDNWSFSTNPPAYNANNDVWDRVSDGGQYFSAAPDGSYFWKFYDIDEIPGIPEDKVCHLTFETVDLASEEECTVSFDYCNRGLDKEDYMSYTLAFDNSNGWTSASEVVLPKHDDSVSTWFTVHTSVPAEAQYCRLRLSAKANFSADCGGFDNIQLKEGVVKQPQMTIVSPVNGAFFENSASNVTIVGTSTNLVGVMVWSNTMNSVSGAIAASSEWSIASLPLGEGQNKISLTATNATGLKAVVELSLLRGRVLAMDALGRIVFVAFNSAGDSFAFVALKELPAGVVLLFTDNTWNGADFGSTEDNLVWSNSVATAAGTVVICYNCHDSKIISNNLGVVVSGKLNLAQDGEEIYAYCGSVRQPTAFLASISTANSNLKGTGLVYGETAVAISKTPASQYYHGARCTQKQWCDYLPLINSAANWSKTADATESWGDATRFTRVITATVIMIQ